MKKMSIVLFLAFVVFISCSFSESPSQVVKKFYSLAAKGKISDANNLISEDGKKMLAMWGMGTSPISKIRDTIKENGGIKNIEITSEIITAGGTATVGYIIRYKNGTSKVDNEKLIKENGKWRITVSK